MSMKKAAQERYLEEVRGYLAQSGAGGGATAVVSSSSSSADASRFGGGGGGGGEGDAAAEGFDVANITEEGGTGRVVLVDATATAGEGGGEDDDDDGACARVDDDAVVVANEREGRGRNILGEMDDFERDIPKRGGRRDVDCDGDGDADDDNGVAHVHEDDDIVANGRRRTILGGMGNDPERDTTELGLRPAATTTTTTTLVASSSSSDASSDASPSSSSSAVPSVVVVIAPDDDVDHPQDEEEEKEEEVRRRTDRYDGVDVIGTFSYDSRDYHGATSAVDDEGGIMQHVSLGSYDTTAYDTVTVDTPASVDGYPPAFVAPSVHTTPYSKKKKNDNKGGGGIMSMEDEEEDEDEIMSSISNYQRRPLYPRAGIYVVQEPSLLGENEELFFQMAMPESSPLDEPFGFRTRRGPRPPQPMANPTTAKPSVRIQPPLVSTYESPSPMRIRQPPPSSSDISWSENEKVMNVEFDDRLHDGAADRNVALFDTDNSEKGHAAVYDDSDSEEETDPADDVLAQLGDALLFGHTPKVLSQFMSGLMSPNKWVLPSPTSYIQQQQGYGGGVRVGEGMLVEPSMFNRGSSMLNNKVGIIDDTGPIKIGDKFYSHNEAIRRWRLAKTKLSDKYFEFDNEGNVKVERATFFERSDLFLGNDKVVESRESAHNRESAKNEDLDDAMTLDELITRSNEISVDERSTLTSTGDESTIAVVAGNAVAAKEEEEKKEEHGHNVMNVSSDVQLSSIMQREIIEPTHWSTPQSSQKIEDVERVKTVIQDLKQTQQQLENVRIELLMLKQQQQQLENIKPKASVLPSSLIAKDKAASTEEMKSSASRFGSINETDEDTGSDTIPSYVTSAEAGESKIENGSDGENICGNNTERDNSNRRVLDNNDMKDITRRKNNIETDSLVGSVYGVEVADERIKKFGGRVSDKSAAKSICDQSALGSQFGTEVVFKPPVAKKVVAARKPRTLASHNMGIKLPANTAKQCANTTAAVKQHVMKASAALKQSADSSPLRPAVKPQTKMTNLPLKRLKLGVKKSART
jgi:hypothetical protein